MPIFSPWAVCEAGGSLLNSSCTKFVDETVLVSDTESDHVLALSFWNSKEDAERYQREQYARINEILAPLLETAPVIRTFDVHTSTTHRIAAGKAA